MHLYVMYLPSDFVTNEQTENGFFELEGNDVALLILKSALLIEKKSVCPEMNFLFLLTNNIRY